MTRDNFDALRAHAKAQGWRWAPGKPLAHGEQVLVSDGRHQATVCYYWKRGSIVVGGASSPLRSALERLAAGEQAAAPGTGEPQTRAAVSAGSRLDDLKRYAEQQGWNWTKGQRIDHGEQIDIWGDGASATVNFWPRRGKMLVQGRDTPLKAALDAWVQSGAEAPRSDHATGPHIGMDESGKGDWFGPLVVAAVFVDDSSAGKLRTIGVRDSKQILSGEVQRLAAEIEQIIPRSQRLVHVLNPTEYNGLYERHGNINALLADVYAEVAQAIWRATGTDEIVCDQFSTRADRLESTFLARGLPAPEQRHHAESTSIAVAAASVLATTTFARELERLGFAAGLDGPLPKGSSEVTSLEAAARTIISQQGTEALGQFAKIHFKPIASLIANVSGGGTLAAGQAAQPGGRLDSAKPGPPVLVEQPQWQLLYYPEGFWRFTFLDGGILDWHSATSGKLDVRGSAASMSYSQLYATAHGRQWGPGKSDQERVDRLSRLKDRVTQLFPPRRIEVTSVIGVSWRQRDTVLGTRFDFTDGTVLQHYRSTDKLQIQGPAGTPARPALDALQSPYWPGLDVLADTLRQLFPEGRMEEESAQWSGITGGLFSEWRPLAEGLLWRSIWPDGRDPRMAANGASPSQRALLDDWSSVIAHHQGARHLLAHAPTGLGKTAAALAPALAWVAQSPGRRRIFYLVNRVAQHDNPISELRRDLAERFAQQCGQPLRIVDIVGRNLLCSSPTSRKLSERCRRSVQTAQFNHLPEGVASWRDVKAHIGQDRCPYHTLQGLMGKAHIVICDYWWIFSRDAQEGELAERVGVSPQDSIIIVDEAHSLPPRARAELDVDETIDRCEADLARLEPDARERLRLVLSEVMRASPEEGVAPSSLLPLAGGERAVRAALASGAQDVDDEARQPIAARLLRALLLPDDMVVLYSEPADEGRGRLIVRVIDARGTLSAGFSRAYATLSMSGTLAAPSDSPDEVRYQIPLFGLPLAETVARKYASPFAQRNQQWSYSPDTIGTLRQRGTHIDRYIVHLTAIGAATDGVTAVFFSSYSFMQQVLGAISDESVRRRIVVERQGNATGEGEESLDDYEQELRARVAAHGGAYLFAVYQGKLAEGANFTGNLIRSVVCISIPLEYPSLFHQRLEALYKDVLLPVAEERGDDAAAKAKEYARDRISLSLVLQACGRGIRAELDRCAFVLLDRRYTDYGWRRFLDPRPYNVTRPAPTVERFLANRVVAEVPGWDLALLRSYRRKES